MVPIPLTLPDSADAPATARNAEQSPAAFEPSAAAATPGPANQNGPSGLQLPAYCAGPTDHGGPAGLKLPALVFCRSRKRVEGVARELARTLGWNRVGACHAELTKEERTAIEQWFFHAEDAVLVATCAYGTP